MVVKSLELQGVIWENTDYTENSAYFTLGGFGLYEHKMEWTQMDLTYSFKFLNGERQVFYMK